MIASKQVGAIGLEFLDRSISGLLLGDRAGPDRQLMLAFDVAREDAGTFFVGRLQIGLDASVGSHDLGVMVLYVLGTSV